MNPELNFLPKYETGAILVALDDLSTGFPSNETALNICFFLVSNGNRVNKFNCLSLALTFISPLFNISLQKV